MARALGHAYGRTISRPLLVMLEVSGAVWSACDEPGVVVAEQPPLSHVASKVAPARASSPPVTWTGWVPEARVASIPNSATISKYTITGTGPMEKVVRKSGNRAQSLWPVPNAWEELLLILPSSARSASTSASAVTRTSVGVNQMGTQKA